jgi:ubiquinol-cytochrome c reductase cytochrome c subunit
VRRRGSIALAVAVAVAVVAVVAGGVGLSIVTGAAGGSTPAGDGRSLFVAGCSYCHGMQATGVAGRGPSLVGVGAQAADFYLTTGRMPLPAPHAHPERSKPAYQRSQIQALVAYVASLGGPPIPSVDPAHGNLSVGEQAFALNCSGCHQIIARGGIVTGSAVPSLQQATATEIGEAVRVGPYLMPRFSTGEISPATLDSLARYVLYTRHPADRGGWGIGHIGPIPEGMVAWLLALGTLLVIARLIGERGA